MLRRFCRTVWRPLIDARVLVLLAALIVTSVAWPVQNGSAANDGGLLSILVMGDSYSAGNGAGAYFGARGCYRSSKNYARQFQREVEKSGQRAFVENVACSGAITNDFFGRSKTGGQRAQILAVNKGYDVIFLTIGGNDLGFEGIVKHCLVPPTRSAKDCAPLLDDAKKIVAGTFRGRNLERRIKSILTAVKDDADPRAKIVLLGYPYLEGDAGFEMRTRGLRKRTVVRVGARIRALGRAGDAVQRRIVSQLNQTKGNSFVFVSTKDLFAGKDPRAGGKRTSHELFAERTNPHRWMVDPVGRGGDSTISLLTYYHPNPVGWLEEARLLTRIPSIPKRDINSDRPPASAPPPSGGVSPQPPPPAGGGSSPPPAQCGPGSAAADGTPSDRIVEGRSIAGVSLGHSESQVRALLGPPDTVTTDPRGDPLWRYNRGLSGNVVFRCGLVSMIDTGSSAYRTDRDMGAGSTLAQVRSTYPEIRCYQPEGFGQALYTCTIGTAESATGFYFPTGDPDAIAQLVNVFR